MKCKSHLHWSWIIIVSFFALSVVNIWFGLFGFLCMGMPIYHALRGKGKVHCAKYCPRGSFLGKFLSSISLYKTLPKFMRSKGFKNFLLIFMLAMFSVSLYHSQLVPIKVAKAIFRLMFASFIVGNIMGIIFRPRSWCQVCPMGHGTALIKNAKEKNK